MTTPHWPIPVDELARTEHAYLSASDDAGTSHPMSPAVDIGAQRSTG